MDDEGTPLGLDRDLGPDQIVVALSLEFKDDRSTADIEQLLQIPVLADLSGHYSAKAIKPAASRHLAPTV